MDLAEKFADAQQRVKALKAPPSTETLLELYALYKQGSVGDVQGARPGMLDFKGRAKYDAWQQRKSMKKEQAIEAYITLVDRLTST
jgi:acyl-CoA-binding protein